MRRIDRSSVNGAGTRSDEGELAQVLDDYLAEVEAGRPVDLEAWVERHPAIADRLRACLKGLHLVEEVAGAIGTGTSDRASNDDGPEFGDFQIVRTLGRGGMGVVFEAIQHSLGRHVALKVLPFGAAFDPRQLARFRVESQAAAQLHHTHIVPVYSVGCERGVHYYAMQLIDGPTLAELIVDLRQIRSIEGEPGSSNQSIARAAPGSSLASATQKSGGEGHEGAGSDERGKGRTGLSSTSTRSGAFFREVAGLGLHAALALEHAHQNGVLHRDVKPSNLMVDSRGHLWVTDFGLARFQGEGSLTETGDLLGTLRYMSPEQTLANSSVVDQRTDVYSLGATLYELLTLEPAFDGSDRQDMLRRIVQEEPRRPRGLNPALPADLETIVLKAMAKDPTSRYASAAALAEDLRRFLDDQPILARRPGPVERLARLARRHMRVVMTVLPLLVVMVIGLTLGIAVVLAKQAEILAKQQEIKNKKDEIERSRADVKRQRDDARRAVDEMYTQVAEDWMSRQTNLQPLQRDFLLKALAYYEKSAREEEADPTIRMQRGMASLRVGAIQWTLGQLDAAEQAFRQAATILEAGVKGREIDSETLDGLARSYVGLAEVLSSAGKADEWKEAVQGAIKFTRSFIEHTPQTPKSIPLIAYHEEHLGELLRSLGRLDESERAFRKALDLEKLIGQPIRLTEAVSASNLAVVLEQTGRLAEAQQVYRHAVQLHDSLVKLDPSMTLYRKDLARTLSGLASLLSKRPGQEPEMERAYRRASGLYERLATDTPAVPIFRQELGISLINLGTILTRTGRVSEAEEVLRRAPAIFEAMIAESPNMPIYREKLAVSLATLARVQREAGNIANALSNAQRAQEIYDSLSSDLPDIRREIARNLGCIALLEEATSRHADAEKTSRRAVAIVEKLATEFPNDPGIRSDLATYLHQVGFQCFRTGQIKETDRAYRHSLEIFEQLVAEAPERADDRYNLARVASNLGGFCFHRGRMEEAERFSQLALHAYEHLIADNFRHDEMIRGGASCLGNLAVIQIARHRTQEGEKSYRRALELLDSLPARWKLQPETLETRGNVLHNLGVVLQANGRLGETESCFRSAQEIQDALVKHAPGNAEYRGQLALTWSHLGALLADRGEKLEARRLLKQAVEMQQESLRANPRNPAGRVHLTGERKALAGFLIRQKAHVDAAAVAEDMLRDSGADSAETPGFAGSCWTLCTALAWQDENLPQERREGLARSYARRAIDALRRGVDSGRDATAAANLCWLLLVCPAADLRDPASAERIARKSIEKFPRDSKFMLALGAARYRSGDWPGAVEALNKGRDLNQGENGGWGFFLAMAQWRQGDKDDARQSFDRAQRWLAANHGGADTDLLRNEAAALLGLPAGAARITQSQTSPITTN